MHYMQNPVFIYNLMAKKDKSKVESSIKNYKNFKIHKNLILNLEETGNLYPVKNV